MFLRRWISKSVRQMDFPLSSFIYGYSCKVAITVARPVGHMKLTEIHRCLSTEWKNLIND